jgi:hypothetical protein
LPNRETRFAKQRGIAARTGRDAPNSEDRFNVEAKSALRESVFMDGGLT